MRFSRGGETVNIVYPDVFSSGYITPPTIPSKGRAYAGDYQNRATTGSSGTLAAGKYTLLRLGERQ
jgi:hypothetical protein